MKVMTFNIQHALDYKNQKIDIDLFVRSIKKYGADICGLNEVRGEGPLEDYSDQTTAIGSGLGYYYYFGEAIKVDGENPYGNAIVSRYPFKSVETVMIPDPEEKTEDARCESRCVIKAVVDIDGKDVCFLVCHMGLVHDERVNAVKTLSNIIDECDIPTVLMGDFNTTPDDEVLKPLLEKLSVADDKLPTFPSDAPTEKIDYIFYKNLEFESVTTINEVISDHLPIIAQFK